MPSPIHPLFVHFPIALYFFELLLLSFLLWKKNQVYLGFALFTFRVAYFFMIVTLITGLLDTGGFNGIVGKVRPHFWGAVSVFLVQTLRGIHWHFGKTQDFKSAGRLWLFSALAYSLVIFTAFEGGEIVYQ